MHRIPRVQKVLWALSLVHMKRLQIVTASKFNIVFMVTVMFKGLFTATVSDYAPLH